MSIIDWDAVILGGFNLKLPPTKNWRVMVLELDVCFLTTKVKSLNTERSFYVTPSVLTWMYRPTSGVDGECIRFTGTHRDSHIRKLSYHSLIHIIIIDLHANLLTQNTRYPIPSSLLL